MLKSRSWIEEGCIFKTDFDIRRKTSHPDSCYVSPFPAFTIPTFLKPCRPQIPRLICQNGKRSVNRSIFLTANIDQSPTLRIAAAILATHLLFQPLNVSATPTMSTASDSSLTTVQQQTSNESKSTKTESELREQSRRNTRVSGRLSQQFSLARRTAISGDLDSALREYNELIKLEPTFAPAYSNRGNILVARRRFDDAIHDYNRALELAPLDGDVWIIYVNRGVARLAVGDDPRAALSDLNAAYDRRGGDPLILQNRAAVYEALGKWESAIRDYQGALKGNEVKPFWLRYALVLFQKGKSTESLAILRRIANSYKVDDVKAAMAVVYFDRGDVASAETQWSGMERPRLFESRKFLESRMWPPNAIDGMDRFRTLKE